MQMNILYVIDGFFPSTGGCEKQAALIAESMAKRDHRVEYACPWLDATRPRLDLVNGISCRRIPFLRIPGLASASYVVSAALFLLRHAHRYEVIHIHMVDKFALALALVRPFVGTPVVSKVAGATEFEGGVFDVERSTWHVRLSRRMILKSSLFQAISRETVRRLEAMGLPGNRILVLPNAIELDRYTPSPALHGRVDRACCVIAFTGRLVKEKSLPNLIRAIAILRDRGEQNMVLRLAGEGPERDKIERMVEELSLQSYVELLGQIDRVDAFLAEAHVYCQVSRIEGLSNSVLEAMSSALPCVLTRISGNEDLLQEGVNGFGVEVNASEALADALHSLIQNRDTCRTMGLAARRGVELDFGLDRVVSTLENCYRGLAPAKPELEHR